MRKSKAAYRQIRTFTSPSSTVGNIDVLCLIIAQSLDYIRSPVAPNIDCPITPLAKDMPSINPDTWASRMENHASRLSPTFLNVITDSNPGRRSSKAGASPISANRLKSPLAAFKPQRVCTGCESRLSMADRQCARLLLTCSLKSGKSEEAKGWVPTLANNCCSFAT